jgi:hypothetical protein
MPDCTCGHIAIGMEVTDIRNWHPDCPEHGLKSAWYKSPEQVTRRAEENARLREMYAKVHAAREAAKDVQRNR